MHYNPEIGKIYDSIFFFYEYYNEDVVRREFINRFNHSEFMVHCFGQIRNKITPPEFLRPLFCAGSTKSSLISDFFAEQIDFKHDTIDDFVVKISSHVDLIYQKTIDKIFENYQKENSYKIFPHVAPAGYLEALNSLDVDCDYKLQVSLLIGNFNYGISLFAELLRKVYSLVDALHDKYKKEIEKELKTIQSETSLKLYEKELQYPIALNDDTTVSVALLNQFVVLGPSYKGTAAEILFGLKHMEALNRNKVSTVSLADFLIACGNELRLKIIYSLSDNFELTLSQLSKIHNTASTTMLRHIDWLTEAHLITISRREGLQIFYKINGEIFQNMQPHILEFLERMQNSKGGKSND